MSVFLMLEAQSQELAALEEALTEARERCDTDQDPLVRLSNVRIAIDIALRAHAAKGSA